MKGTLHASPVKVVQLNIWSIYKNVNTLGTKEVRVEGREAQKNVCVEVHKLKHLQMILYKEVNVWIFLICKCTNTSPKISDSNTADLAFSG